jgi:seryl-tRNA synthetase
LGKILTVLVVLVAVAVAVLVTTQVFVMQNWKAAYEKYAPEKEGSLYNQALQQRDSAFQQRDKTRGDWDTDKAAKDQIINTLTDELNVRKGTITTLTTDKENQEKRLAELAETAKGLDTSLKSLVTEKDAWRKERDDAMKKAEDLMTMNTDLDTRLRVALKDLEALRETLRQATEEKAAVESKIAWILQNFHDVKLPQQVPAVPSEMIKGIVTAADNEAKTATINLGADNGVVKGMKFLVYNAAEGKYLATLTVGMVSKNSAAGDLSVIRGSVKANDNVTNRFE